MKIKYKPWAKGLIHTAYNQLPELLFNSSSVNYTIASIANFNKYVIFYLTYFAKCFTIRYDDLISIPYIHSIILSVR